MPEDLPVIEKKMKEIIARDKPFTKEVWSRDRAKQVFRDKGENFKVELIDAIPEDQSLKIYKQGDWFDLCRGPHMTSTGKIGNAFKLMKVAGAYWRGDSNNPMLTRIYGTAFAKQEELDAYLKQLEEAEKRDHRRVGREMDLFHFQEEAPGSVFWHPKGWTLFQALENYIRRRQQESGFVEVNSPQLMDRELWVATGHIPTYNDHDVPHRQARGGRARLRHQADELPGPRADFQERPEVVSRSADENRRVRQGAPLRAVGRAARPAAACAPFTQDDAHIFIMESQIAEEVLKVNDQILSIYKDFGFDDVRIKFSDRPDKRIGDDAVWDKAEGRADGGAGSLRTAVVAQQRRRRLLRAEARIRAARRHRPRMAMRHRAGRPQLARPARRLLHRREFQQGDAGDAPPRHVRLARTLHRHADRALRGPSCRCGCRRCRRWSPPSPRTPTTYAREAVEAARKLGLRVEGDLRNEKINYKVREHSLAKVPVLLVIGKKEAAERLVSIRRLGSEGQQVMPLDEALKTLAAEAVPPDVKRAMAQ